MKSTPKEFFFNVLVCLVNPTKALVGDLILMQLFIKDGPASPSSLIGLNLTNALKGGWISIAAFIGALSSFFSGSATISNLTFGSIQKLRLSILVPASLLYLLFGILAPRLGMLSA